jgi:hypothetical protein
MDPIFVLARYGYAEAWSSRITVGIFTLSLLPCLVFLIGIYLANNPMARLLLGNQAPHGLVIDARFFLAVMNVQYGLALILASWIAPRLITFDLADDALPILLSHPISRFGYVFGKWVALFASLSLVTWIPWASALWLSGLFLSKTLGRRKSPHSRRLGGGSSDLDCLSLPSWPGLIFVGQVESCGYRRHLCGNPDIGVLISVLCALFILLLVMIGGAPA